MYNNYDYGCGCCCPPENPCQTGPMGPIGLRGLRGLTGPAGPTGPAGALSAAYIFSRIIIQTSVEVTTAIPFPLTIYNLDITNPTPFTTFTFAQTGFYLLNLTMDTDITQVSLSQTDSGGTVSTPYLLSTGTENKALTVLLEISEIGTTLQIINSLGTGAINAANLTIVKIAELPV